MASLFRAPTRRTSNLARTLDTATAAKKGIERNARSLSDLSLARFHLRTRKRAPWLQTVILSLVAPVLACFAVIGRYRVVGREHIPSGGYIVIANHPSVFDPIFVSAALRRRIRFMGKSDIFRSVSGAIFSRLGAFPVRRGVWDTEAFETSARVIERGRVFAMFPEGGVVEGAGAGERGVARPGLGHVASQSGARILPVYLHNTRALHEWWRLPRVEVRIGEPIDGEHRPDASRDEQERIAQRALDAVYDLA